MCITSLWIIVGTFICSIFFVKNRIIIYFVPLIFLILADFLLQPIGLGNFSFLTIMQPFGKFSMWTYAICVSALSVGIISLVSIKLFKKDVLV